MRVQSLEQHAKSRVHQMAAAQVSGNDTTLVNGIRAQCLDPIKFRKKQTHLCLVSSVFGLAMLGMWRLVVVSQVFMDKSQTVDFFRATKVRCLEEMFSELCYGKLVKESMQVNQGNGKLGYHVHLMSSQKNFDD